MFYNVAMYPHVSCCAIVQKASSDAEQRAAELASLVRQHASLASSHGLTLKEMDALHAAAASAAARADEAAAELALVRESQAALTAQVRISIYS